MADYRRKCRRLYSLMYTVAYGLVMVALVVAYIAIVTTVAGRADTGRPVWAAPQVMALKRVADLPAAQHEAVFAPNIDCSLLTYRLPTSSTMRTGCFTGTAFGLFDSGSSYAIYNGTDEALPLLAYTPHHNLVTWPRSGNLIDLVPGATAGSYISLYRNPLASAQDQRDPLGRLTAKQLVEPPDIPLKRPDGQSLLVNAQTMAFSENGSWMVVETLSGSFIRLNLASLEMLPFAKSFASSTLLDSRIAVSRDGSFAAIYTPAAARFNVYDLNSCLGQTSPQLSPLDCASYDYQAYIEQQLGPVRFIGHPRFLNNGLLSIEVTAADAAKSGIYELAPAGSIDFLSEYLGLGDSFTSGEGAFDYLAGTDTGTNNCHLSRHSYPLLLASDLFGGSGGHSVACSGAKIKDIGDTSDNYQGQAGDTVDPATARSGFIPGYLAQYRFAGQYQPRVMTVSIGGNDLGFGEIVKTCVTPKLGGGSCYASYEDRAEIKTLVDRTIARWTGLFRQLADTVPGSHIYAIGYPDVVDEHGSCALNVQLDQSERVFIKELVSYINDAVRQAAAQAGIGYIDVTPALAGHRLCETISSNVAVNGVTAGNDHGPFGWGIIGRESYHPNALGQLLMEQAILRATNNFASTAAASSARPSADGLLAVPASGRALTNKSFQVMAPEIVAKGASVPISVDGQQAGLRPGTAYDIRLDGPTGPVIGSATSDQNGNISSGVTIPGSAGAGGHSLDATGPGQADQPVDVSQPIIVSDNPADLDGDGRPDATDSCPALPNSGQDTDQDGLDDSCDGYIGTSDASGPPPVPPAEPATTAPARPPTARPPAPLVRAAPLANQAQIAAKLAPVTPGQPAIPLRAGQNPLSTPLTSAPAWGQVKAAQNAKLPVITWWFWPAGLVAGWLLLLFWAAGRRLLTAVSLSRKIRISSIS